MPREYEAIRDALVRRGTYMNEAQRIAAATYNKRHQGNPMGPDSDVNRAVRERMRRKHR